MRYVALLRAINVGGHVVKMEHLRTIFASMGFTDIETGCAIADAFLATDFSGDERHARRLAMVSRFEADGSLPEG